MTNHVKNKVFGRFLHPALLFTPECEVEPSELLATELLARPLAPPGTAGWVSDTLGLVAGERSL